jgi:hypothetical protein
MVRAFAFSLLFVIATAKAQIPIEQPSEADLLAAVEAIEPGDDAAAAGIWKLCQTASQTKKSQIHWRARIVAEKIAKLSPLSPRAQFAYGFFRAKEGIETADPLTQQRRLHEGRRLIQDAVTMGSRDGGFLLDAGLLILSLSPKIDMIQRGLDALAKSRRQLGDEFDAMPAGRRADWHAGMGKGLSELDLPEMARNYFEEAKRLAPESPSGEMAIAWLKARYGNG